MPVLAYEQEGLFISFLPFPASQRITAVFYSIWGHYHSNKTQKYAHCLELWTFPAIYIKDEQMLHNKEKMIFFWILVK